MPLEPVATPESAPASAPCFASHGWLPVRRATQNAARLGGWWFSLATLYASTGGACPCCGRGGCPVGFSGAGLVAAAVALVMQRLRRTKKESTP